MRAGVQRLGVGPSRFKDIVRADDVGLQEVGRPVDGAVDVAFGRQVHHGVGLVPLEHARHRGSVADVDTLERVAVIPLHRCERLEITRVRELVDGDHVVAEVEDEVANDGGANESSTSGNEDPHRTKG